MPKHTVTMVEGDDGQITITADNDQVYQGGSWPEANTAMARAFFTVAFAETGDARFDPKTLDVDPLEEILEQVAGHVDGGVDDGLEDAA